jgi:metal-sulfur cluster biosynthetic enzyme
MMAQDAQTDLKESVLRALSTVTDPELDEPITELGFVKNLSVSEDGRVSVDLVTSTFWCSPNFVYMMLEEARDVVSKLPGVKEMHLTLGGHHDSDRINEAINAGKSFSECYDFEARGELVELNQMIRTRALRSRLYSMAAALLRSGLAPEEISELTRKDVIAEGDAFVVNSRGRIVPITDPADAKRVARYLTFVDGLGRMPGPLVIWDLDGNPPAEGEFVSTLMAGRLAKANFSLNAELCRALLASRLDREEP